MTENKTIVNDLFPIDRKDNSEDTKNYDDCEEDLSQYCEGGYHPVKPADILNDRYVTVRKLGWGKYSTVWYCFDRNTRRLVAIKIMKSKSFYTRTAKREIKALKIADGSAIIVQLLANFDVIGVNGVHKCLVFEALGKNLLTLLASSGFRGILLQNVKTIIKQVLEGLDYLHTKCNLIHLDIKPDNIVFCEKGLPDAIHHVCDFSVKIVDLGCVRRANGLYDGPAQALSYRCPEAILRAGCGPTADVWSVACLAFELATGDFLFNPVSGENYSEDEYLLALMIQLLGEIPKNFALSGRRGEDYFLQNGKLKRVPEMRPTSIFEKLTEKYKWNVNAAEKFQEFLLLILKFDPKLRASAAECLEHEWLNC